MHRVVLAVALVAAACTGGPAPGAKQRPPPLVVTKPVLLEDVPVLVRAPTDLKPIAQADIASKNVGLLDAVLVDRGDLVKKGQLLALVRPSDLPDQLAAAKGSVAQAEAAVTLSQSNLERAQALAPKGLVSQQELQSATTARAGAEAQLAAAQANLAVFATRLGETRLEAPYDGVVVSRRLDPGALVGPTLGPILTVARIDTLRAFVPVTERLAGQLKLGQVARLKIDALGVEPATGRVERLAPAFDPLTRTLDAEVHLPNVDGRLRPGMYGRAEIEIGRHPNVPVVYAEAVQISDEKAFVFIAHGDTVSRKSVVLGEDLGDRLEVVSGLAPGDEIVVRGIDNLADGMKIRTPGKADAGVPGAPAAPPTR
jgi:RND family efflux transporter MFP subunit